MTATSVLLLSKFYPLKKFHFKKVRNFYFFFISKLLIFWKIWNSWKSNKQSLFSTLNYVSFHLKHILENKWHQILFNQALTLLQIFPQRICIIIINNNTLSVLPTKPDLKKKKKFVVFMPSEFYYILSFECFWENYFNFYLEQ